MNDDDDDDGIAGLHVLDGGGTKADAVQRRRASAVVVAAVGVMMGILGLLVHEQLGGELPIVGQMQMNTFGSIHLDTYAFLMGGFRKNTYH